MYNLQIYIDADYKKTRLFTPAPLLYACRYSFAMSTHVCNVLSIDFVQKSWFESCFWSAQCIEAQTRTSENVKTWVFKSLNVQWWNFTENAVFYNFLRSNKATLLELEKKTKFTGATPVPMFTIITPCPYTHSKQSKTFHAKCNVKVNCEKKWVW